MYKHTQKSAGNPHVIQQSVYKCWNHKSQSGQKGHFLVHQDNHVSQDADGLNNVNVPLFFQGHRQQ